MLKWLFLIVGLAGGFFGGNYWAVHNPDKAAKLSAQEEQQVLEQTQALKNKLDQLISKQKGGPLAGVPGSGFVGSSGGSGTVDPDLQDAAEKAQAQLNMLKSRLGSH